jgi:RNA polymerase sigma-70 factor (ECF subfamily)
MLARHLMAVANGDVAGLHALYEATKTRLFVVCLGIVREREAAEDVLQEVYLKVWNRAAGYDEGRGSPWPWLAMIARNTAIDWARAHSRRANLDGAQYLLAREEEFEAPADEHLVQMQEGDRAMREVEHLDEAAAQCLRAAFVEGLSYSEVAEREGLPLGTVKSRIRRALRVLRGRMADG